MAGQEFPSAPPDVDGVRHGTGGGAEPQEEPGSGIKDDGYPLDHIQASRFENFVRRRFYDLLNYLRQQGSREFDSLATALDSTSGVAAPESFKLRAVDGTNELRGRGEVLLDLQGAAGAVTISAMATDGERLYYAQGTTVYAVDPDTGDDGAGGGFGTFIWSRAIAAPVTALAADGQFVYVAHSTGVGDDVETLNRDTGVILFGDDTFDSLVAMAANGARLVGVGADGSERYQQWSVSGTGVLTSEGFIDYDADVLAVAMDDEFAWCGGVQDSGGADVHRIVLSTQTENLSITLPTVSAATVRAICADGSYVFVFIDELEVLDRDGALARVFCLDRLTGDVVWFSNFGVADPVSCAVDHAWLYAGNAGDDTFVLDKANGKPIWFIADTVVEAVDGLSVFGTDGGTDQKKNANGLATLDMQAALGTDINRRPFFNLAIPRDEVVSAQNVLDPPIFGREKDQDENLSSTSTASETFVNHQSWVTDILQGGTYRIEFYYVWRHDNNTSSNSFEAQVDLDEGTIIHSHVQQPQSTSATQRQVVSGFKDLVLSAATHQIDVDLQRVGGAGTVTIEESRLSIYRVA